MTILKSALVDGSVYSDQAAIERESRELGRARYWKSAAESIERGDGASLKPAERLSAFWFTAVRDTVALHASVIKRGEDAGNLGAAAPIAILVDPDKVAAIACSGVLSAALEYPQGAKMFSVCYQVGMDILTELGLEEARKKDAKESAEDTSGSSRRRRRSTIGRLRMAGKHLSPEMVRAQLRREMSVDMFRQGHAYRLGAWAVGIVLSEAIVPEHTPRTLAFQRFRPGPQRPWIVVLRSECLNIIDHGHAVRQYLRPTYRPMVHPPVAWSKDMEGGYATIRTPLVSRPTRRHKELLEQADLSQTMAAINAINGAPLRTNLWSLAVMKSVWKSGGGRAKIVFADDEPLPPRPAEYDASLPPKQRWTLGNTPEKKAYKLASSKVYERNAARRTQATTIASALSLAETAVDLPTWFPVKLCYRGRYYPLPVGWHYQGPDHWMGLLEFHRPVEVTPDGRKALMLQAAAMWKRDGVDELPLDRRIDWAESVMGKMLEAAQDPLGTSWWENAKRPWQFLSACKALADESAGRHAMVQIDGSANGYQHYAAISRDRELASLVNLTKDATIRSPYAAVMQRVRHRVERDAAAGVLVGYSDMDDPRIPASEVIRYAIRDVGKTPVMTVPYNVSSSGMVRQVAEAMTKHVGTEQWTAAQRRVVAAYLVSHIRATIGEVATSACEVMTWLKTCAGNMARGGLFPEWHTPLGFPVVQDKPKYRREKMREVQTCLGKKRLRIEDEPAPPRVRSHINGIGPNTIHCLDAANMHLATILCQPQQIDLCGKHDGYLMHASHRWRAQKKVLQAFFEVHKTPFHHRLAEQWRLQCEGTGIEIPDPPPTRGWDIAEVLESEHGFC